MYPHNKPCAGIHNRQAAKKILDGAHSNLTEKVRDDQRKRDGSDTEPESRFQTRQGVGQWGCRTHKHGTRFRGRQQRQTRLKNLPLNFITITGCNCYVLNVWRSAVWSPMDKANHQNSTVWRISIFQCFLASRQYHKIRCVYGKRERTLPGFARPSKHSLFEDTDNCEADVKDTDFGPGSNNLVCVRGATSEGNKNHRAVNATFTTVWSNRQCTWDYGGHSKLPSKVVEDEKKQRNWIQIHQIFAREMFGQ